MKITGIMIKVTTPDKTKIPTAFVIEPIIFIQKLSKPI